MARTFLSAPLKDEVDRSAMCTLREIVKPCVVLACRKYDGDWHEEIACFTLRNLNEANFHLLRASYFGRWKPPPDYLITSRQCDRPRLAWISAQIANRMPYVPLIAGSWLRLLETLDHALLTPDESRKGSFAHSKWGYGLFWLTDRIFNCLFVWVFLKGTTPGMKDSSLVFAERPGIWRKLFLGALENFRWSVVWRGLNSFLCSRH